MPKQKTHKGASKRFRLTASGLVKRSKAYKRHILTKKTTKRKRNLRKAGYVSVQEAKTMRTLIPYK